MIKGKNIRQDFLSFFSLTNFFSFFLFIIFPGNFFSFDSLNHHYYKSPSSWPFLWCFFFAGCLWNPGTKKNQYNWWWSSPSFGKNSLKLNERERDWMNETFMSFQFNVFFFFWFPKKYSWQTNKKRKISLMKNVDKLTVMQKNVMDYRFVFSFIHNLLTQVTNLSLQCVCVWVFGEDYGSKYVLCLRFELSNSNWNQVFEPNN